MHNSKLIFFPEQAARKSRRAGRGEKHPPLEIFSIRTDSEGMRVLPLHGGKYIPLWTDVERFFSDNLSLTQGSLVFCWQEGVLFLSMGAVEQKSACFYRAKWCLSCSPSGARLFTLQRIDFMIHFHLVLFCLVVLYGYIYFSNESIHPYNNRIWRLKSCFQTAANCCS